MSIDIGQANAKAGPNAPLVPPVSQSMASYINGMY